jgi:hypothetical protein
MARLHWPSANSPRMGRNFAGCGAHGWFALRGRERGMLLRFNSCFCPGTASMPESLVFNFRRLGCLIIELPPRKGKNASYSFASFQEKKSLRNFNIHIGFLRWCCLDQFVCSFVDCVLTFLC